MTDNIDSSPADTAPEPAEAAYHLRLDATERALTAQAVRLLIADEAHEPDIRQIAREVMSELEREPPPGQPLVAALTAPGMKITHSALKLLLDDLRRDQADEQRVLRQVLDKLPDEHAIRAIVIE